MSEHIIFIFYIVLFLFSIIGHGEIFSRIVYRDMQRLNIGYLGIIGFFSLSLYSILSSYFFAHNFFHNTIIHLTWARRIIFIFNKGEEEFSRGKIYFSFINYIFDWSICF